MISSNYYMEWKTFIEASYAENIHSGENVFATATVEGLKFFKLKQSQNNCQLPGALFSSSSKKKIISKKVFIFLKIELFSSNIKHLLYFLIFEETETLKTLTYFRKWSFSGQAQNKKNHPIKWKFLVLI